MRVLIKEEFEGTEGFRRKVARFILETVIVCTGRSIKARRSRLCRASVQSRCKPGWGYS
jgi:hypothetical protein